MVKLLILPFFETLVHKHTFNIHVIYITFIYYVKSVPLEYAVKFKIFVSIEFLWYVHKPKPNP